MNHSTDYHTGYLQGKSQKTYQKRDLRHLEANSYPRKDNDNKPFDIRRKI